MEKYKPTYLGKVIPADDPSKLTDFVNNKYDAFSKMYDTVKEQSDKIDDIKAVDTGGSSTTLSVKLSTDNETLEKFRDTVKSDNSVTIKGDVITTTGDN